MNEECVHQSKDDLKVVVSARAHQSALRHIFPFVPHVQHRLNVC